MTTDPDWNPIATAADRAVFREAIAAYRPPGNRKSLAMQWRLIADRFGKVLDCIDVAERREAEGQSAAARRAEKAAERLCEIMTPMVKAYEIEAAEAV